MVSGGVEENRAVPGEIEPVGGEPAGDQGEPVVIVDRLPSGEAGADLSADLGQNGAAPPALAGQKFPQGERDTGRDMPGIPQAEAVGAAAAGVLGDVQVEAEQFRGEEGDGEGHVGLPGRCFGTAGGFGPGQKRAFPTLLPAVGQSVVVAVDAFEAGGILPKAGPAGGGGEEDGLPLAEGLAVLSLSGQLGRGGWLFHGVFPLFGFGLVYAGGDWGVKGKRVDRLKMDKIGSSIWSV